MVATALMMAALAASSFSGSVLADRSPRAEEILDALSVCAAGVRQTFEDAGRGDSYGELRPEAQQIQLKNASEVKAILEGLATSYD